MDSARNPNNANGIEQLTSTAERFDSESLEKRCPTKTTKVPQSKDEQNSKIYDINF